MADCVVPLLRVTAQLPTEVAEQCAVFVICTAAHPLARHIHEIPQVVLADDPRLHAERQPHRGILARDAELVQPGKMLLNFHHQFIVDCLCGRTLRNAGRRHIVKAMLIVDIARAGLQPCRLTADMGVPLPDHPRRISLQRQIDIRKLKRSSMPALQTVQPSAIVLFFIRGVRTPADPRLKPDHRDRVLACVVLNHDASHHSFLLFCTNAVMQF